YILFLVKKYYYELSRNKSFYNKHGYKLNIKEPKTFNDKIYFRKYNGNYEFMGLIADKYKVRDYVESKIGAEYLIPLLGVYDSFSKEDWNKLPQRFVLKSNHGSGVNHIHIIINKDSENAEQVIDKLNRALNDNFGEIGHQPFYQKIDRVLLAEEYLDSGSVTPDDYKFHCFGNKILIQVDRGRYGDHQRSIYDENWSKMNYKLNSSYPGIIFSTPPKNLDLMIDLAKKLASDFDYVRVDFYNLDGKIYFGELTQTHGNGKEDFEPARIDFEWGEYWDLDLGNKSLYK
ncbi:hypothetical protein L4D77_15770, partial [Photobacterium frigidiphilum]|uniref:ATP-grasp fold amidoligase family protein n=1 Tax=Photobacterium frigidiphilum TaxID=264736 RepID=UPI003D0A4E9C